MKYLFRQSATFGQGATFGLGHHEVPERVVASPYFKQLVKAGLVIPADSGAAAEEPKVVPHHELQKQAMAKQKDQLKGAAKEEAAPEQSSKKGKS